MADEAEDVKIEPSLSLEDFTLVEEVGEDQDEPEVIEDREGDPEPVVIEDQEDPVTVEEAEPKENEQDINSDPNFIPLSVEDEAAEKQTKAPENVDDDDESETDEKKQNNECPAEDADDPEEATHPYLYLVETFELPKDVLNFTTVGPVKTPQEKQYWWINSKLPFQKMLQNLRTAKEIAIELHVQAEEFGQPVCLIAVATRETNYLIDVVKLRSDILMLTEIFINPQILKIVYDAKTTLVHLQQKLHLYLVNIFDVAKAKYLLRGGVENHIARLSKLIRKEFDYNRVINMKHDFKIRPISEEIKKFCIAGVHYLIYIYHDFKNKLMGKSMDEYKKYLGECREACKVVYSDSKKMSFKRLQDELLNRQKCQLEVMKKLFNWRNVAAKKRNIRPDAIINNIWLLKIISDLPSDHAYIETLPRSMPLRAEWDRVKYIVDECKATFQVRDVKKNPNAVNKPPKRKNFEQEGPPPKKGKNKNFKKNDGFAPKQFFNQNRNHSRFGTPNSNYSMQTSTPMMVNTTNAPAIYPFQAPMNSTHTGSPFGGRINQEEDSFIGGNQYGGRITDTDDRLRNSIANLKEASANIRRQVSNNEEEMLYRSLVDLKQARDSVRRQCGSLPGSLNTRKYQDLESINQEISRLERQVKDVQGRNNPTHFTDNNVQGRNNPNRFNDNNSLFRRRY